MPEDARSSIFVGRKDKTTSDEIQYIFTATSTDMATPGDILDDHKQKPANNRSIPFVHDHILNKHPRIRRNQHLYGQIIYTSQHKVYSIRTNDISICRPIKIIIGANH